MNLENIQNFLIERGMDSDSPASRETVREELAPTEAELEEFFGHGPLTALLGDDTVTEILVNGPGEVWAERDGKLSRMPAAFHSEQSLKRYVRRLLSWSGRKVDLREPFADATLPCGSRLHVAGPPVAKRGFCLSIRKFSALPWTLERFINNGSVSAEAARFLQQAVKERRNILVAGGTGTGKTSLLGALLGEADPLERILLLEDISEIRTRHPQTIALEARPPNQEGEGRIDLQRLLRESLRMRPERIVVGECRGKEALDLLMALNTGHPGSMATIHANSPREALLRLETLALLAGENLKDQAVKSLVNGGIHLVAQLERTSSGRRLSRITELKGVDSGSYMLKEWNF